MCRSVTPAAKGKEKRKEISPNEERDLKQARNEEEVISTLDSEKEERREGNVFKRSSKLKRSPTVRLEKKYKERENEEKKIEIKTQRVR